MGDLRRGTLLKQTCAGQGAQKSACKISIFFVFLFPKSQRADTVRSTRLVILIKNIYSLWGQKRFLLFFPTNFVYSFTLRVTDIRKIVIKNPFLEAITISVNSNINSNLSNLTGLFPLSPL